MTWVSSRDLLPAALLIGLLPACASSGKKSQTSPPEASTVTSEDLARTPGQPIERILESRFPGVSVARTADGGISVRIRGVSSFQGSNEPLYVLDGIPIQAGPGGSLTGINPYDIASIQVLKNPSETALYGMRGANGVIVIKTKRPGQ